MTRPRAIVDPTGRVLVSVGAAAAVAGYRSARTAWPSLNRARVPRVLLDGRAYIELRAWLAALARRRGERTEVDHDLARRLMVLARPICASASRTRR
jgi:hypothetical protein